MRMIWRYSLALITVALALIITSTLQNYTDRGSWPSSSPSCPSTTYFVAPLYTFRLGPKHLSFLVVFGVLAVLTSWMSSKRRRAEEGLRQARDELEMRVQERTKELRQAFRATL